MRNNFREDVLKAVPAPLRDEANNYICYIERLCRQRYATYRKIKEQIIRLKTKKRDLTEYIAGLESQSRKMENILARKRPILNRIDSLDVTEEFLDKRDQRIRQKERRIVDKENKLDEKQQELTVKGQKIAELREMQNTSYFKPTLQEERLFIEERRPILEAVQQYGTITRALKHCQTVTTKAHTIKYYEKKYPEFASDLQMAYEMWKDNLDSAVIDRALEGTDRPVFQKGEYLGDYKFKSDKLLELAAKAHVPEKYDRGKLDRIEGGQAPINFNIINFNTADEAEEGGVRDIGVVKSVDKNGNIDRITKDKRLLQNADSKLPDENYEDLEQEEKVIDI